MPLRPSQITLFSSLAFYPLLARVCAGKSPTPSQLTASLKGTSTLHSVVTTCLALYFLRKHQWLARLYPASATKTQDPTQQSLYPDDSHNPTITLHSELGNSITALEAGYLISDTFALLLQARLHHTLDKTLLTHHALIGSALLLLQYYIARGREAGIYIIVQFLLMNASTPFLNLRWYLRNYSPEWRMTRLLADWAFAASFFAARVGLVWKILADYGSWHGWRAWETYSNALRLPCQMGTGALFLANAGWWGVMVVNLVGKSKEFTFGGQ